MVEGHPLLDISTRVSTVHPFSHPSLCRCRRADYLSPCAFIAIHLVTIIMSGTAEGKVEIKTNGEVVSTFTLHDDRSFTYKGNLNIQEVYAVKDCTCKAVLHYKAPSQGGDYTWTSEKKDGIIQVTVTTNDGNKIIIDIPESNLVKRSDPTVQHYDANVVPKGTFSLAPLA